MSKNRSILILTAQFGEGHVQTAQTIANQYKNRGYNRVYVCDLYGIAYPAIHSFAQTLLKKSFTKFGAPIYKMFYYGTDKLSSKGLAYFYQHLGKKRLLELIERYNPTTIITTFPLHAGAYLRFRLNIPIPTYTVITDYCAHPLWTHPMIEKYYVASCDVKDTLISFGVTESRIKVTGIPIRSSFSKMEFCKKSIYQTFALKAEKKTVTFLGGGLGLVPNILPTLQYLLKNETIQIAIVCGKNQPLKEKLEEMSIEMNGRFRVYGYLNNLHELLLITDCLVTKAGAITLTEAAALKIPMVLLKPNPGQESENTDYFKRQNAVIATRNDTEVINGIHRILFDANVREQITSKVSQIYYSDAADRIVSDIIADVSRINTNIKTVRQGRM